MDEDTTVYAPLHVTISDLTRYGRAGWMWQRTLDKGTKNESTMEFRTNGAAEGLWQYDKNGIPNQIKGTGQFSLPQAANRVKKAFAQRARKNGHVLVFE